MAVRATQRNFQQILEGSQLQTSHSIINQNQINRRESFLDNFENHGEQYLNLTKHSIRLAKTREACCKAAAELFRRDQPHNSALLLSIAKFGIGECAESASLAGLECIKRNLLPAYQIIALSSTERSRCNSHVFIIFDPDKDKFANGKNCLEAISQSQRGVVIDPFFQTAFSVSKLANSSFATYLQENKIHSIYDVLDIPSLNDAEIRALELDAERIYRRATEILQDPHWKQTDNRLFECLVDLRMRQIRSGMNRVIWRRPKNSEIYWTQGPLDAMSSLSNWINSVFGTNLCPIKTKKNPNVHVVKIERHDFLQMTTNREETK